MHTQTYKHTERQRQRDGKGERERRRNGEREYLLKVTSVENGKAKTHSDFHMNCKKGRRKNKKMRWNT